MLTLNRPQELNALNGDLRDLILDAIADAKADLTSGCRRERPADAERASRRTRLGEPAGAGRDPCHQLINRDAGE